MPEENKGASENESTSEYIWKQNLWALDSRELVRKACQVQVIKIFKKTFTHAGVQ